MYQKREVVLSTVQDCLIVVLKGIVFIGIDFTDNLDIIQCFMNDKKGLANPLSKSLRF